MSVSFNLDNATHNIRNIVDCNRCRICDKLEGVRVRFECGHPACGVCVANSTYCILCLTPSNKSSPINDPILQRRTENVSELLNSFQVAFSINVYKNLRLSEQLKKEKELFPQCIQAPIKYTNKRKSLQYNKGKENRLSKFPGEIISSETNYKMEKSRNVEQWLDKYKNSLASPSARQPFGDLSVNSSGKTIKHTTSIKKRADKILDSVKIYDSWKNSIQKRTHYKTLTSTQTDENKCEYNKKTLLSLKSDVSPPKRLKVYAPQSKNNKENTMVITDSEPIVIDDSQPEFIDKDRQAWLAVLEAENNLTDASPSRTPFQLECNENVKYTIDIDNSQSLLSKQRTSNKQVPFFKKGLLSQSCQQCDNSENKIKQTEPYKDVAITIENNSFITTIKVSRMDTSNINTTIKEKHSVPVQTDVTNLVIQENISNVKHFPHHKHSNNLIIEKSQESTANLESQDLFTNEEKMHMKKAASNVPTMNVTKMQNEIKETSLLIADSDSDLEINNSYTLEVKADVHESCPQIDYVLAELNPRDEALQTRTGNRAVTPSSTNSSEKENYNPNKMKRKRPQKKKNKSYLKKF